MKTYTKNTTRNAAEVSTPIAEIFKLGESEVKSLVLNSLKRDVKEAHLSGKIHIHDLESYSLTYNCLNLKWVEDFKRYNKRENSESNLDTIFNLEFYLMDTIYKLGNDQSGGISFPNFDIEVGQLFEFETMSKEDVIVLKRIFKNIIKHLNYNKTRQGQVSYYVTFNLGLDTSDMGRLITKLFLEAFIEQSELVFKPNIVYKVSKDTSLDDEAPNRDLLNLAIKSTVKKMIPTYLMVDSKINKDFDPIKQSISGCRSRIYENINGEEGAIGRYNITSTSINLPRIAFESGGNIDKFFEILSKRLELVERQLLDRNEELKDNLRPDSLFTFREKNIYSLKMNELSSIEDFLKNGTYSIGYIGLYETVYLLTGKETNNNDEAWKLGFEIVKFMREYTDKVNKTSGLNFSLISPAGEMISGRFLFQDRKLGYNSEILKKEFYTNSFHLKVDSNCTAEQKLRLEAPFHKLSNGGCISYIELFDANEKLTIRPKGISTEQRIINNLILARELGINYLGFNFPIDICKECRQVVQSDICENCGSSRIANLRRVSGYIETLETFVYGKKNEEKKRTRNE